MRRFQLLILLYLFDSKQIHRFFRCVSYFVLHRFLIFSNSSFVLMSTTLALTSITSKCVIFLLLCRLLLAFLQRFFDIFAIFHNDIHINCYLFLPTSVSIPAVTLSVFTSFPATLEKKPPFADNKPSTCSIAIPMIFAQLYLHNSAHRALNLPVQNHAFLGYLYDQNQVFLVRLCGQN